MARNIFKIIEKGTVEELEAYIKDHPDVLNQTRKSFLYLNNSPLTEAIQEKKIHMAFKLLELGADPNVTNCSESHALIFAIIYYGDDDIGLDLVDALLKSGAKLDHQDNTGRTAFMYAAASQKTNYLKVLKEAGANINLTDNDMWTALHVAAQHLRPECYQYLLQIGIDRTIRSNKGQLAYQLNTSSEFEHYHFNLEPLTEDDNQAVEPTQYGEYIYDGHGQVSITKKTDVTGITTTTVYDFDSEKITTLAQQAGVQSPPLVQSFSQAASLKELEAARDMWHAQKNTASTSAQAARIV